MKRTYVLTALTIVALLVWIVQKTSLAFLSIDQTDFVGGLTVGLLIGTVIAWWASKTGT